MSKAITNGQKPAKEPSLKKQLTLAITSKIVEVVKNSSAGTDFEKGLKPEMFNLKKIARKAGKKAWKELNKKESKAASNAEKAPKVPKSKKASNTVTTSATD